MSKLRDELDGVFQVELGKNQKGYLWGYLSPKSKKELQEAFIKELERIAEQAEQYMAGPYALTDGTIGWDKEAFAIPLSVITNSIKEIKNG